MPEIILVRHGVPECDHLSPIRGHEFARWVRGYDNAPLDRGFHPPRDVRELAAAVNCIVSSTLRRSFESAALLAPQQVARRDAVFDEAGIPTSFGVGLALRPAHWDGMARLGWMLGWSDGAESVRAATERAGRAAGELVRLAGEHGSVMLVGHGMLNTLITRELRRRGWVGGGSPRRYWGMVRLAAASTEWPRRDAAV